jgi:hypothetical protein
LKIKLGATGDDGVFDLGVRVNGPGVSPFSRPLALTVDRSGPRVDGLVPRIRDGFATITQSGGAQTYLRWEASDEVSGVRSSWLQRKIGSKPWRKAGAQGASSSRVTLKPGQANKFRVKATDKIGNRSTSSVLRAQLVLRDTKSSRLVQPASGGWKAKTAKKAYNRSLLVASSATDSLITSFNGMAVAVVASVGPKRGTFRVRIDDRDWTEVSLKKSKAGHRKVVWSRKVAPGPHTLQIQGLDGSVAIDAVLIVR